MAKWIDFVLVNNTGKTMTWEVRSKDGYATIGNIKWYSRWRRYAFFPGAETTFESDCLTDIIKFLDEQMAERKKRKG